MLRGEEMHLPWHGLAAPTRRPLREFPDIAASQHLQVGSTGSHRSPISRFTSTYSIFHLTHPIRVPWPMWDLQRTLLFSCLLCILLLALDFFLGEISFPFSNWFCLWGQALGPAPLLPAPENQDSSLANYMTCYVWHDAWPWGRHTAHRRPNADLWFFSGINIHLLKEFFSPYFPNCECSSIIQG